MISLWSRAAQARSICNCSACVAATGRLAQRTARTSVRRPIGRPDTFTLLSSTLMLSAAVTDGVRKERKLQDWDKIVEETKGEIEAVEQEQRNRLERVNVKILFEGEDSERPIERQQAWLNQVRLVDMLEWAKMQEKQRISDGFQDWKGIQLNTLRNLTEADLNKVLSNKKILHRFYGGPDCSSLESVPHTHVYSLKKLRTIEWSILKLVVRLLHIPEATPYAGGEPDIKTAGYVEWLASSTVSTGNPAAKEDLANMSRRLEHLASESETSDLYQTFPSPCSPRYLYSPSQRGDQLKTFNINLQNILSSIRSISAESISKICAHLLKSTVAPDIHTYNLLLVKFCQLRQTQLVTATHESLRETHMRPNEITHATLLRFFNMTRDKDNFLLYIQRMNGFQKGLALANPSQPVEPLAISRYRRFGSNNVKIAELARLNSEVYTCLIKGLLEMFQFKVAAWYYANMIREGWKPTIELFIAFLDHCCQTGDIISGWSVWRTMLDSCQSGRLISRKAYEIMLELCRQCGKTRLFYWILQDGLNCGVLPGEIESSDSGAQPQNLSVVSSAVDHTITETELRERFPYVPVGIIRERLFSMRQLPHRILAPIEASRYATKDFYNLTRNALLRGSFKDAQDYVANHYLVPENVRKAIVDEARWVYELLQELTAVNQRHMASSQEQALRASTELSPMDPTDDYADRTKAGEPVMATNFGKHAQGSSLVAAIREAESKLDPRIVRKAYEDFRKAARVQENEDKRVPPSDIRLWTPINIPARNTGQPWMQSPTSQDIEVEAG